MKKLLILFIFINFQFGNAQNQDTVVLEPLFDIGLHYPLSTGDNFIANGYVGLIGADIRYQFTDTRLVSVKAAVAVDYFDYTFFDDVNGGAFVIKPEIIGEFNIVSIPKLKPYVSLGYSFFSVSLNTSTVGFDIINNPDPVIQPNDERFTDTQSGISYGFGVAYDITAQFFLEVSADFIKLDLDGDISGNRFNENIHTVSMGVGVRL
ncbi:outer membrane beta-barrel protein [Kordia jejudonensis]|uniref:outer membrane beta-barrel protein n=1 Tax=Kordia jejudonensis TaxID=1348245 RepID=UPI00138DDC8B|nr:outer membrane beta-barrel protein [Kordia jejudonensis]